MKEYLDTLTGLNNMLYLFENYASYTEENPDTYTISIDFEKLKYINDNFGHAVGDLCIITFANIIREIFAGSLLIRRSGDEFIIVSPLSYVLIVQKLNHIIDEIEKSFQEGIIPITFRINCGIKKSEKDLKETLFKADITMYHAKNNRRIVEKFNDTLVLKIKKRDEFIEYIDNLIEENKFNYEYHSIYDVGSKNEVIREIYVRDDNKKSILSNEKFEILKTNYRLKRIDLVNIKKILDSGITLKNKHIINIHFQTISAHEYSFVSYFKKYMTENELDPKLICLSINTLDYSGPIHRLIEILIEIKELGVELCIDSFCLYERENILSIISLVNVEYVKISKKVLVKAMNEKRLNLVLTSMIKMFLELNIKPIFVGVETKSEHEYIKKLSEGCLVKGYYYSKEQNLDI